MRVWQWQQGGERWDPAHSALHHDTIQIVRWKLRRGAGMWYSTVLKVQKQTRQQITVTMKLSAIRRYRIIHDECDGTVNV